MVQLLFRHTATLGIRELTVRRETLSRSQETVDTAFGPVGKKISTGYGVHREKYEYEDLARIAQEQGLSLAQVLDALPQTH